MAVPNHLLQRAVERLTQTVEAEGIPISASVDVLLEDDWSTTVTDASVADDAPYSGIALLQSSIWYYIAQLSIEGEGDKQQYRVVVMVASRYVLANESLGCIVHGWARERNAWDPSDIDMRRTYGKRMGILARNLHELFRGKYDVVFDSVFVPLLQEYISYRLQHSTVRSVKRSLRTSQEAENDNDAGQGENDDNAKASSPPSKRLRLDATSSVDSAAASSSEGSFAHSHRLAEEEERPMLVADNVDVQRQISMMRREHPRARDVVNAFLAIPDLMKDGRAKLSGILREYVIPYATDRRFLAAVMLCLGAVLYRTQPAWVAMLQDSFQLARDAVLSAGRADADAQMLRSLEAAAQEATPDLDQIRHLIGSIKCEGSASSAFSYYFHLQGKLPNRDYYYGLGKAALCGIFTSLKIVEPLA